MAIPLAMLLDCCEHTGAGYLSSTQDSTEKKNRYVTDTWGKKMNSGFHFRRYRRAASLFQCSTNVYVRHACGMRDGTGMKQSQGRVHADCHVLVLLLWLVPTSWDTRHPTPDRIYVIQSDNKFEKKNAFDCTSIEYVAMQ